MPASVREHTRMSRYRSNEKRINLVAPEETSVAAINRDAARKFAALNDRCGSIKIKTVSSAFFFLFSLFLDGERIEKSFIFCKYILFIFVLNNYKQVFFCFLQSRYVHKL